MLTVAHRAGNSTDGLRAALAAGADLVELDVHRYRGRLEVRHHKWLGRWHLWEPGEIVARSAVDVPVLADIIDVAGTERLMLDLKGVHPGLAPAVAELLRAGAPGRTVTVCTQHWWMLTAFAGDPHVRQVLSAGSRRGLARLRRRIRRGSRPYGVAVRLDLLTPPVVAELRAAGPQVLTWPVDTPVALDTARHLAVTGVISTLPGPAAL